MADKWTYDDLDSGGKDQYGSIRTYVNTVMRILERDPEKNKAAIKEAADIYQKYFGEETFPRANLEKDFEIWAKKAKEIEKTDPFIQEFKTRKDAEKAAPKTDVKLRATPPEDFTKVEIGAKNFQSSALDARLVSYEASKTGLLAVIDRQNNKQTLFNIANDDPGTETPQSAKSDLLALLKKTVNTECASDYDVYIAQGSFDYRARESAENAYGLLRSQGVPEDKIKLLPNATGMIVENGVPQALSKEAVHALMSNEAVERVRSLDPDGKAVAVIENTAQKELPEYISFQNYKRVKYYDHLDEEDLRDRFTDHMNPSNQYDWRALRDLSITNRLENQKELAEVLPDANQRVQFIMAYSHAIAHAMYSQPDRFMPNRILGKEDEKRVTTDLVAHLHEKISTPDDVKRKAREAAIGIQDMMKTSENKTVDLGAAYSLMDLNQDGVVKPQEARPVLEQLKSQGVKFDIDREMERIEHFKPDATQQSRDNSAPVKGKPR
jgi:hypothetical protein